MATGATKSVIDNEKYAWWHIANPLIDRKRNGESASIRVSGRGAAGENLEQSPSVPMLEIARKLPCPSSPYETFRRSN